MKIHEDKEAHKKKIETLDQRKAELMLQKGDLTEKKKDIDSKIKVLQQRIKDLQQFFKKFYVNHSLEFRYLENNWFNFIYFKMFQ